MRMQFLLKATSLCLALGGVVGTSGCDDITSGTIQDDPGAPKLVRVMFQDDTIVGGRGIATDLLDAKTGQACSDTNPCPAPFRCGERNGEVLGDGKCHNHNSTLEVAPPIGNPVGRAGLMVRMIFSKIIDPKIESVVTKTCAKSKAPCKNDDGCKVMPEDTCSVDLAPGAAVFLLDPPDIATLVGPDGKTIAAQLYYDPTGSPTETSDPIFNAYGPGMVLRPNVPLAPSTEYTIKLKAGVLKDRKGQSLADNKGASLGEATEIKFTMEGLFIMQQWNCPSFNCINDVGTVNWPDTTDYKNEIPVAPNHYYHFQINADIDEETADKIEFKNSKGEDVKFVAFNDRGGDAAKCDDNQDYRSLNIVAVDKDGHAVKLAADTYTLKITGIVAYDNDKATIAPLDLKLKVGGEDANPDEDPFAIDNVLLPSDCAK